MMLVLALSFVVAVASAQAPPLPPVVIGYLDLSGDTARASAFRRGVDLGIAEATRTGDLLRRSVRLALAGGAGGAREVARSVYSSGAGAVIARVGDSSSLDELAAWSIAASTPVLAVGYSGPPRCDGFIFHITPPSGVTASALLAPLSERPTPVAAGDSARRRVALWHPGLERFGAAQLSERFKSRYGTELDSDAWAGWMAVKVIWESSLRSSTTSVSIRDAIAKGTFDGHKGRPLRFGPDGILRQPLVVVARREAHDSVRDSLVAEVPWPAAVSAADVAGDAMRASHTCDRSAP